MALETFLMDAGWMNRLLEKGLKGSSASKSHALIALRLT
jgi:hypothetical protein